MRPFTVVEAPAVPVYRANIDTDVLIPINRIVGNPADQLGPFLFDAWRTLPSGEPNPEFELNFPRHAGAEILVAGENFGCGSSREHAVWALVSFGVRCVIAPSFGDIFRQNCFQNGVLPLTLDGDAVRALVHELADPALEPRMTVDLERQVVRSPRGTEIEFESDAERRQALLEGLDDIGMTLKLREQIVAFEASDAAARPWSYLTPKEIV